jgi:hypothetical protein
VSFAFGRDDGLGAEQHLTDTLEKHAVQPPADLLRYRHHRDITADIKNVQLRQADLVELGDAAQVERCQLVIEALERERRGLSAKPETEAGE